MPQPQFEPYTAPEHDGRRKIPKSLYPRVIATYKELKSYQKTADHFGVSKRLVIFIVNPKKLEELKAHYRSIQHHKIYYDKDKRREYMRTYRAKKRLLDIPFKLPYA